MRCIERSTGVGRVLRSSALALAGAAMVLSCAVAQDIAGIEDCTKTSGLDRRTGCLQANVNYLQRTMTRNALEAHRRLQAAEAEIIAMKSALAALRQQLDRLQSARPAGEPEAGGKTIEGKAIEGEKTVGKK